VVCVGTCARLVLYAAVDRWRYLRRICGIMKKNITISGKWKKQQRRCMAKKVENRVTERKEEEVKPKK